MRRWMGEVNMINFRDYVQLALGNDQIVNVQEKYNLN